MIVILSPEPDTYGQYARASLLADNDWNLELIEAPRRDFPDEEPGALSERLDGADEGASIVFRQIDERRYMLAERYPFVVADDLVSFDPDVVREENAYVAVLALTIAHAFNVAPPPRPEVLFEQTVTDVLRERGLPSVGLAALRRGAGSFADALRAACSEVGLKAAPDAAPRLARAHDEGVDILCHIGWERDLRPGTWGFIGQVTVGRSDSWGRKIREPSPHTWALLAGTRIPPLPFLAVPHHVERPMMEKLTVDGQAVVLDRLRLVRFKQEINREEREIVRAVTREEIEPLVG